MSQELARSQTDGPLHHRKRHRLLLEASKRPVEIGADRLVRIQERPVEIKDNETGREAESLHNTFPLQRLLQKIRGDPFLERKGFDTEGVEKRARVTDVVLLKHEQLIPRQRKK